MRHDDYYSDAEYSDDEFDEYDPELYKQVELNNIFEKCTDIYADLQDFNKYSFTGLFSKLRDSSRLISFICNGKEKDFNGKGSNVNEKANNIQVNEIFNSWLNKYQYDLDIIYKQLELLNLKYYELPNRTQFYLFSFRFSEFVK